MTQQTTQKRYSLNPIAADAGISVQMLRRRCERLWPWHRGHWQLTEDEKQALEADLKEFPPRRTAK